MSSPREILAAYVREHLPEVWDGDHEPSEFFETCLLCEATCNPNRGILKVSENSWEYMFDDLCCGPDLTQDIGKLWTIATRLYPHLIIINSGVRGEVWSYPDSEHAEEDRGSQDGIGLEAVLVSTILAGIEARL